MFGFCHKNVWFKSYDFNFSRVMLPTRLRAFSRAWGRHKFITVHFQKKVIVQFRIFWIISRYIFDLWSAEWMCRTHLLLKIFEITHFQSIIIKKLTISCFFEYFCFLKRWNTFILENKCIVTKMKLF